MKAPELRKGKDKDVGIPFDGKGVFFCSDMKNLVPLAGQS